ncbi:MAG: GTP cyclohydrolase I [Trebouxia sp. A1-2]|nr:MAG: GTP cyclohydrolase I [Trebouxia sp. A1-2]
MGASAISTDDSGASVTTADLYPEADLHRLQNAVRVLLSGVGENISREGLQDTPKRVAKAWVDVSSGYRQDLHSVLGGAIFHEPIVSEGSGSMVIVRDIEFASTSEANLLPFYGRCHVAYVPSNGVVLGLSKLARVTKLFASQLQSQQRLTSQILFASQCEHHMLPFHGMAHIIIVHSSNSQKLTLEQVKALILSFSHRLQIQERLTNQLADAIQVVTGALGCVITCEAAHMCMVARGVEKHASSTITLASRGLAAQDSVLRGKLLLRLSQKRT